MCQIPELNWINLAFEREDSVSLQKIVKCLNDAGTLEENEVHTVFLLQQLSPAVGSICVT